MAQQLHREEHKQQSQRLVVRHKLRPEKKKRSLRATESFSQSTHFPNKESVDQLNLHVLNLPLLSPPDSAPEQRQRLLLQQSAQRDRVAGVRRLRLPDQGVGGPSSRRLGLHLEGRLQRDRPGRADHLSLHGGQCVQMNPAGFQSSSLTFDLLTPHSPQQQVNLSSAH